MHFIPGGHTSTDSEKTSQCSTACTPTGTDSEQPTQCSTASLTPCTPSGTDNEQPTQCLTVSLTPCIHTGTDAEHNLTCSAFCLNLAEHNSKLSSLGKCILSVVQTKMENEVLTFDRLRSKIKSSQSRHRLHTSLSYHYQAASTTLRDHLIQEYQEVSSNIHTHSQAQTQNLQHKLNVLRRGLNHEWKLTIQSPNMGSGRGGAPEVVDACKSQRTVCLCSAE